MPGHGVDRLDVAGMDVEQQELHVGGKGERGREVLFRQVDGCRVRQGNPLLARKLDGEQVPDEERHVRWPDSIFLVATGDNGQEGYLFIERALRLHIPPDTR